MPSSDNLSVTRPMWSTRHPRNNISSCVSLICEGRKSHFWVWLTKGRKPHFWAWLTWSDDDFWAWSAKGRKPHFWVWLTWSNNDVWLSRWDNECLKHERSFLSSGWDGVYGGWQMKVGAYERWMGSWSATPQGAGLFKLIA